MDNAQNNNTAMEHFHDILHDCGIKFIPQQQHIHCFSHIIHLSAEAGLAALPTPEPFDPSTFDDPALEDMWLDVMENLGYTGALQTDLVGCIQELVQKF
jgi:hypothetical protein